jgi:hypothetical protein
MRTTKAATLGAMMLCALGLTGCFWVVAGAAGGAGAYSYSLGKLEAVKEAPVATVQKAAVDGLKDLEIRIVRENVDKLTGQVEGSTAQGKTVTIRIDRQTENTAKLSIRVGTGMLSDEKNQTMAIYDAIEKRLK